MSVAPSENRREAVYAIEEAIEVQLELLSVPVPEHSWLPGDNDACSFTVLFWPSRDEQVAASFSSHELDCFNRSPAMDTLTKIDRLTARLHEEHLRLAG